VHKSKETICIFFYTDGADFNGKRNRLAFFFWFSKKNKKRIRLVNRDVERRNYGQRISIGSRE
jgi:hypothetical protein